MRNTKQFELIQDLAKIGIWEWHILDNSMLWSPEIYRQLDYRPDEVEPSYDLYFSIIHPDDRQYVETFVTNCVSLKKDVELDYRLITKAGELRYIRAKARTYYDEDGRANLMEGYVQEVTDSWNMEAKLWESNQRLQAFTDNSPASIYIKDREGRYTLVNRRFLELSGRLSEEVIGKSDMELFSKKNAELYMAEDRLVFESGKVYQLENNLRVANVRFHFVTNKFPLKDSNGNIFAVGGISTDISEVKRAEKALENSEEQLRLVIDAFPSLIAYVGNNCRYRFVNRSYETWFGVSHESIIGSLVKDIVGDEAYREIKDLIRQVLDGKKVSSEKFMSFKLGAPRYVSITFIPYFPDHGKVKGFFAMIDDISESKKAEENRLMRERSQRDTLVREVHHRIKNNLQSVVGLLKRQAEAHHEIKQLLDEAINQVNSIAIVHGLQGNQAAAYVDVRDMCIRIIKSTSELAHTPIETSIDIEDDVTLTLLNEEAVPIALIVNELITNAIKHNLDGTKSSINVSLSFDGLLFRIFISNKGELPEVFDYESNLGLGMGLSLVKPLMPLHGASLKFDNQNSRVTACFELKHPVVELSFNK